MAVVFDFDGVLVDTRADNIATLNSLAAKYRFDPLDHATYTRMCEHNFYEYWKMLLGPAAKEFFREIHCIPRPHAPLRPGMKDILESMRPAIVSSNNSSVIRGVLAENGVRLPHIYGGDVEHSKIVKLRRIKGEPDVFVTDTAGDVQEGRIAGYIVVAVTWGFNSPAQLDRARPHFIVENPEELAAVLAEKALFS